MMCSRLLLLCLFVGISFSQSKNLATKLNGLGVSITKAQLKSTYSEDEREILWDLVNALTDSADQRQTHPFNKLTAAYIAAPSDSLGYEIKEYLVIWKWNHSKYFSPILARHKNLEPLRDISENLERLAKQAVMVLEKQLGIINYTFNANWYHETELALRDEADRKGRTQLAVFVGLKQLLKLK
jgi:hypothetical protein